MDTVCLDRTRVCGCVLRGYSLSDSDMTLTIMTDRRDVKRLTGRPAGDIRLAVAATGALRACCNPDVRSAIAFSRQPRQALRTNGLRRPRCERDLRPKRRRRPRLVGERCRWIA